MPLIQLNADNFRLFDQLSLSIPGRLNLFVGDNAAGKTSVLEAAYTLARGKSFRVSSSQELVGVRHKHWTLFGRTQSDDGGAGQSLGVGWQDGATQMRVNGQSASTLELLDALSVQIIEPSMHRMLQDGPTYRRSFIDWGVFHVEPLFLPAWRRYRRALKQRNQALRLNRPDAEIAIWEPELAEAGEAIDRFRQQHLHALQPVLNAQLQHLTGQTGWQLELYAGWARGSALLGTLEQQRSTDRKLASTQAGPHRAELKIRLADHTAKHRISRGQQKMLIAAMILAQSHEVARHGGRYPLLLIDDFEAELAAPFQHQFAQAIAEYPGQVWITAFARSAALDQLQDVSLFHVEHGQVKPKLAM